MREFIIDTAIPIGTGMLIGQGIYNLTESFAAMVFVGCPLAYAFGAFVYPPIAKFLRG